MNPRVSVVMPVYGDLRFLDAAVGSVLRQTFSDFELIIVDDGNCRDRMFAAQAERDPRIHVIASRANEGNAGAANRAVRIARGEIIARLDADDIALPGLVAAQVAALDADPALCVVGTWFASIDESGARRQSHRRPQSDFEIRWTRLFANPFLHSSVAFRRSSFDAAGGYDATWRVTGDYEFWFRLLDQGRGANLQQELLHYRENTQGLTLSHRDGWYRRNDPLRRRAWESLGVPYDSSLADQLARIALGDVIYEDALRAPAYRAGLALLRRLAAAERPRRHGDDRAEVAGAVRGIFQRMRDDPRFDSAAIDADDLAWVQDFAR